MKETFEISVALGNALVQYLATKPYAEVSDLIIGLQQAASQQNSTKEGAEDVESGSRQKKS